MLSCNLVNAETYFDEHLRIGDRVVEYSSQEGQTVDQWHELAIETFGLRRESG